LLKKLPHRRVIQLLSHKFNSGLAVLTLGEEQPEVILVATQAVKRMGHDHVHFLPPDRISQRGEARAFEELCARMDITVEGGDDESVLLGIGSTGRFLGN
jgi:hypothetical protein